MSRMRALESSSSEFELGFIRFVTHANIYQENTSVAWERHFKLQSQLLGRKYHCSSVWAENHFSVKLLEIASTQHDIQAQSIDQKLHFFQVSMSLFTLDMQITFDSLETVIIRFLPSLS